MGYIYKIVNKINNKIYIGQTIVDLEERWKGHIKKTSNCRYLKSAFNKYGINNFKIDLICICFDKDLDYYEINYIEKFNSLVPNGYNLRKGGNGGKQHEETKQKISNTLKIINSNRVCPKTFLGKNHKEETKIKISNSLVRVKKNPETILLRKNRVVKYRVIQKDLNNNIINIYNNCVLAANSVGTFKNRICNACNGKIKTVKGYIWEYEK